MNLEICQELGQFEKMLESVGEILDQEAVSNVEVVKEHAKETNVAKNSPHSLLRVASVIALCIDESRKNATNCLNLFKQTVM